MNLLPLFDLLIGTSFLLGFVIIYLIKKYMTKTYVNEYKTKSFNKSFNLIKELFKPSHNQDKKYLSLLNYLRIDLTIMIISIWGKVIFFVMNR